MRDLPIEISRHAQEQMHLRGVDRSEVIAAIRMGEAEPARHSRIMYRKNFQFNSTWRNRQYRVKQVAPVVAVEPDRIVVVTVYAFYF